MLLEEYIIPNYIGESLSNMLVSKFKASFYYSTNYNNRILFNGKAILLLLALTSIML